MNCVCADSAGVPGECSPPYVRSLPGLSLRPSPGLSLRPCRVLLCDPCRVAQPLAQDGDPRRIAEILLEKLEVEAGSGLDFPGRLQPSKPEHIYSGDRIRIDYVLSMGTGEWEVQDETLQWLLADLRR